MTALPVTDVATTVVRAAVTGGLFAGAVWLLCRLVPRLPARVRATLWWLVCLKLLVGCVWMAPIELPLLPAPTPTTSQATVLPAPVKAEPPPAPPSVTAPAPAAVPRPRPSGIPWVALAVLAWALGVAAGALLTAIQAVRLARTVRTAQPVTEGPTAELLTSLRHRLGLPRNPALKTTSRVTTPQAVGLFRPAILLPPAALAAPRSERTMVLCHELVHLRRRDPWLAWVPLLARRLFFFHPLAALAQREFVLAREAACDAEVLRLLGTAPRAYGRLLLRWGVAPRETGLAAAGASSSVQDLKRRLQMLDKNDSTRRSSPWWWLAAATLVLGLVPVTIVAQAPPAAPAPPAPPADTAAAPGASAPVPAPDSVPAPAPAPTAEPGEPAMAGALPALPAPPSPPSAPAAVAPAPAALPKPPTPPVSGTSWVWSDDGEEYGLVLEGSRTILHGDTEDADHMRALQAGDEPLLWFRRDGVEYVVRDHKMVEAARRIVMPQMKLAQQQGELGGQQGKLGGQQGELGARQGALGAQQAELASRQAALAVAAIGSEDTGADRNASQRELAERMRELGEKQRELGEQQRALGEKQRALGAEQRVLGKKQREASERAREEMKKLIDRAFSEGLAERVE